MKTETIYNGLQSCVVGSTQANLILETLGKIYIKTGGNAKLLDDLIEELAKTEVTTDKSKILYVNSLSELETMDYPGLGYFVFCKSNKILYMALDSNESNPWYVAICDTASATGSFVKTVGDVMTGLLEIYTDLSPLIVSSKQLVKNLNVEYLNGLPQKEYAVKKYDETISGDWTHNGINTCNANWIFNSKVRHYDTIVTSGSITSPIFTSGFAGQGWSIDADTNTLTIDYLVVRKAMMVYEMVVNQISATNGSLWISNSSVISKVLYPLLIPYTLIINMCNNNSLLPSISVSKLYKAFNTDTLVSIIDNYNTTDSLDGTEVGFTYKTTTLSSDTEFNDNINKWTRHRVLTQEVSTSTLINNVPKHYFEPTAIIHVIDRTKFLGSEFWLFALQDTASIDLVYEDILKSVNANTSIESTGVLSESIEDTINHEINLTELTEKLATAYRNGFKTPLFLWDINKIGAVYKYSELFYKEGNLCKLTEVGLLFKEVLENNTTLVSNQKLLNYCKGFLKEHLITEVVYEKFFTKLHEFWNSFGLYQIAHNATYGNNNFAIDTITSATSNEEILKLKLELVYKGFKTEKLFDRENCGYFIINHEDREAFELNGTSMIKILSYYRYFCGLLGLYLSYLLLALNTYTSTSMSNTYLKDVALIYTEKDKYPVFKPGDIIRCLKFENNNIKYYDALITNQISPTSYLIKIANSVFDLYTEFKYDEDGNLISAKSEYNNSLYKKSEENYSTLTGEMKSTVLLINQLEAKLEEIENNSSLSNEQKEALKEVIQNKIKQLYSNLTKDRLGNATAEDDIVQMGSICDKKRLGAVYITSSDDKSPFMDVIGELDRPDYSVTYDTPIFSQLTAVRNSIRLDYYFEDCKYSESEKNTYLLNNPNAIFVKQTDVTQIDGQIHVNTYYKYTPSTYNGFDFEINYADLAKYGFKVIIGDYPEGPTVLETKRHLRETKTTTEDYFWKDGGLQNSEYFYGFISKPTHIKGGTSLRFNKLEAEIVETCPYFGELVMYLLIDTNFLNTRKNDVHVYYKADSSTISPKLLEKFVKIDNPSKEFTYKISDDVDNAYVSVFIGFKLISLTVETDEGEKTYNLWEDDLYLKNLSEHTNGNVQLNGIYTWSKLGTIFAKSEFVNEIIKDDPTLEINEYYYLCKEIPDASCKLQKEVNSDGNEIFKHSYKMSTKVRVGNLNGIYNEVFGNKQPYGYGLYGENVFLTGEFYLNNGTSVVDFAKDRIILQLRNGGLYINDNAGTTIGATIDLIGDKIRIITGYDANGNPITEGLFTNGKLSVHLLVATSYDNYDESGNILDDSKPYVVINVDDDGKIIANDADIKGKITATSGKLGGFTISDGAIIGDNNSNSYLLTENSLLKTTIGSLSGTENVYGDFNLTEVNISKKTMNYVVSRKIQSTTTPKYENIVINDLSNLAYTDLYTYNTYKQLGDNFGYTYNTVGNGHIALNGMICDYGLSHLKLLNTETAYYIGKLFLPYHTNNIAIETDCLFNEWDCHPVALPTRDAILSILKPSFVKKLSRENNNFIFKLTFFNISSRDIWIVSKNYLNIICSNDSYTTHGYPTFIGDKIEYLPESYILKLKKYTLAASEEGTRYYGGHVRLKANTKLTVTIISTSDHSTQGTWAYFD